MSDITPGCCPHCGVINRDYETLLGRDGGVQEGDVMICESCAKISLYVGHGATRIPDDYELATLLEEPDIAAAVLLAELDLMGGGLDA